MKLNQHEFGEIERRHAARCKRPKPPRSRPRKGGIALAIGKAGVSDKELRPFAAEQLVRLLSHVALAPLMHAKACRGLQDIAGTYLRQRQQPDDCRPQARYELEMLAYATATFIRDDRDPPSPVDLRHLLSDLDGRARTYLWGGLERHPEFLGCNYEGYLRGAPIDWRVIGQAAEIGCSLMVGGPYGDKTATLALIDLIRLFETATGTRPTFSVKAAGTACAGGGSRKVGNSSAYRFAAGFFKELGGTVEDGWVATRMQALLHRPAKCSSAVR